MFGYIKKDEVLKTLKEEMELQKTILDLYGNLASTNLERKLSATNESDRRWYDAEYQKYIRWADEANHRWREVTTIYNMVKQM